MVNYKLGKIYKLVNNVDNEIYVGSTCSSLAKRKAEHKIRSKRKCTNRKVYKHCNEVGWENVGIVLIEKYPCDDKSELFKRERFYYDLLNPSLNMNSPKRSKQDKKKYNKSYWKKHGEYYVSRWVSFFFFV